MKDKGERFKLYLGFKTDPPDPFTNQVIFEALRDANISTDHVVKEYKGKGIRVWVITPDFARNLYRSKMELPIFFEIYAEQNYTLQKYRLLERGTMKKAKYGKYKRPSGKKL